MLTYGEHAVLFSKTDAILPTFIFLLSAGSVCNTWEVEHPFCNHETNDNQDEAYQLRVVETEHRDRLDS